MYWWKGADLCFLWIFDISDDRLLDSFGVYVCLIGVVVINFMQNKILVQSNEKI